MSARPLPADIVTRFERFSDRLEREPLEQLIALAARPLDPAAHDEALADAERLARERHREAVLADAYDALDQFVHRQYSGSPMPWTTPLGSPGTPVDRVRLVRSLHDAAAALLCWDLLDEGDRDELLGPWQSLAT
jgi:hypothetical protein